MGVRDGRTVVGGVRSQVNFNMFCAKSAEQMRRKLLLPVAAFRVACVFRELSWGEKVSTFVNIE